MGYAQCPLPHPEVFAANDFDWPSWGPNRRAIESQNRLVVLVSGWARPSSAARSPSLSFPTRRRSEARRLSHAKGLSGLDDRPFTWTDDESLARADQKLSECRSRPGFNALRL